MFSSLIVYEIHMLLLYCHRDFSDNLLYGDIPFSISKLKQLDTLYVLYYYLFCSFPLILKFHFYFFLSCCAFSEPFNLWDVLGT